MHISHLGGMILFALLASVAFASLGHRTLVERARHAGICFALFMGFAFAIAWLLYPLSR